MQLEDLKDLQEGTPVIVDDSGTPVRGYVENVRLKPSVAVNVRVIHKGHKEHGRIIAFAPEQIVVDHDADPAPAEDPKVRSVTKARSA